jgi:hypothetical protein
MVGNYRGNTIVNGLGFNMKEIINSIDYFTNISEDDYISYDSEHSFAYTSSFLDFIVKLQCSGLVGDDTCITDYELLKSPENVEHCEMFSLWVQEMNKTLSRPCEMRNADIDFIRRAFLTVIKMEKIFPGSWGIDVETGTWLKLLRRVKELYESGEIN